MSILFISGLFDVLCLVFVFVLCCVFFFFCCWFVCLFFSFLYVIMYSFLCKYVRVCVCVYGGCMHVPGNVYVVGFSFVKRQSVCLIYTLSNDFVILLLLCLSLSLSLVAEISSHCLKSGGSWPFFKRFS